MISTSNRKRLLNLREQAEEAILRRIQKGALSPGTCLPPIRTLSSELGISFRTVQQALTNLQAKGYVAMRQGAGTFVESVKPALTMNDAVVLCIETQAHVFGELASLLTRRLHVRGQLPSLVDSTHPDWRDLIRQAARSEAQVFVVHGGPHFHYEILHEPLFTDKRLIGLLDWTDPKLADRISLVTVDHQAGIALVARHLADRGHQRVLLAGPDTMLHVADGLGQKFRAIWQGEVAEVIIRYTPDAIPSMDAHAAAELLRGPTAPTAVFGLRDYDVVCLHRALLAEGIDLHATHTVIGYGNTPWSRGPVEFSTVDWNLETIAEETCRMIASDAAPRHVSIPPRLVVRGNQPPKSKTSP